MLDEPLQTKVVLVSLAQRYNTGHVGTSKDPTIGQSKRQKPYLLACLSSIKPQKSERLATC